VIATQILKSTPSTADPVSVIKAKRLTITPSVAGKTERSRRKEGRKKRQETGRDNRLKAEKRRVI